MDKREIAIFISIHYDAYVAYTALGASSLKEDEIALAEFFAIYLLTLISILVAGRRGKLVAKLAIDVA